MFTGVEKHKEFLQKSVSHKIEHVVDAYEHALLYRYPRARYLVGWDANTVARMIMILPEWVGDWMFSTQLIPPLGAR